ncbi:MAG: putative sugar nucleotidyl transferase [Candidatus Kuenenbacteria bacterium]
MKIIFFEDNQSDSLRPVSLGQPAFDIFCAASNLYQVCQHTFKNVKIDFLIRDYLLPTARAKHQRHTGLDNKILLLNGSLIPSYTHAQTLYKKIKSLKDNQGCILQCKQQTIGALIYINNQSQIKKLKANKVIKYLAKLDYKKVKILWPIFNHLYELITYNQKILGDNLKFIKNGYQQFQKNVYIGKQIKLSEQINFDASDGPIIIDDYSQIQPFSYLKGPLYIGKNCLIKEFSSIKNSSIGPVCRIGGEIESSIIQGYSNKQHYGFVGHSYIGQWVNIAAGATISDLKNTYGQIKMDGKNTKKQLMGCIIGDYSKISTNTNLFAGKIIGINSFLYGNITNDVSSFTNVGSWLEKKVSIPLPIAIKTQKLVFARRSKKQTKRDIKLLENIYQLTAQNRRQQKINQGKVSFI